MIQIISMTLDNIDSYTDLFMEAFSKAPWYDKWTKETAFKRLSDIMNTGTFVGFSLVDNGDVIGFICGQKEQFFDGVNFQIQEFCVANNKQGMGYGTKLLNELTSFLNSENITNIYLITSKEEKTKGYYLSKGFNISSKSILMEKNTKW